LESPVGHKGYGLSAEARQKSVEFSFGGKKYNLNHGSVVIAVKKQWKEREREREKKKREREREEINERTKAYLLLFHLIYRQSHLAQTPQIQTS